MKDCTFSRKDLMFVVIFLQEFQSAWHARRIHKARAFWLFEKYLTNLVMASLESRLTLMNGTNSHHEGPLKSYSAIAQFLLKNYVAYVNIAKLDAEVRHLRQEPMTCHNLHKHCRRIHCAVGQCTTRGHSRIFIWKELPIQLTRIFEIGLLRTNTLLLKIWHRNQNCYRTYKDDHN